MKNWKPFICAEILFTGNETTPSSLNSDAHLINRAVKPLALALTLTQKSWRAERKSQKKQRRKTHGARTLAAGRGMGSRNLWSGRIGRSPTDRSLSQDGKRFGSEPIGLVASRAFHLGRNARGVSIGNIF
jgi:hypothetical protein